MPRLIAAIVSVAAICAAAAWVVLSGSGPAGARPGRTTAVAAGSTATATTATSTATATAATSTATTATSTAPAATSTAPAATSTAPAATSTATRPPVAYGLGDAQGMFARCIQTTAACCYGDPATCPAGTITGFFSDPWFKALTSATSAHRVSYVRLFVSIDAVSQWNGSLTAPGCGPSTSLEHPWTDVAGRLHPAGESLQDLLAGLVEARADGLTPVVSIAGYIPTAEPSYEPPAPDPTTVAGYWNYRCGVLGILGAVSRLPTADQPHVWEALNEPETFAIYRGVSGPQAPDCAVRPNGAPDGPAKAACDYVLGERLIHGFAGHANDTVLAGVFSRMDPEYLAEYVAQLARVLPASQFPASWAVHDYSGVTRAFMQPPLARLTEFDSNLARDSGGRARDLWITETGMLLSSQKRLGDCPAVGTDPTGSIGACISANPTTQAADIDAFFELPQAGARVPITHLFWYQWQGEHNWDSGLTDASGVPRTAWCALYGSGACVGNPAAS